MICVTRFNGSKIYINADLIQTIEVTPDAVITLTNNVKIIVKEPPDIIVEQVIRYHQEVHNPEYFEQAE